MLQLPIREIPAPEWRYWEFGGDYQFGNECYYATNHRFNDPAEARRKAMELSQQDFRVVIAVSYAVKTFDYSNAPVPLNHLNEITVRGLPGDPFSGGTIAKYYTHMIMVLDEDWERWKSVSLY